MRFVNLQNNKGVPLLLLKFDNDKAINLYAPFHAS